MLDGLYLSTSKTFPLTIADAWHHRCQKTPDQCFLIQDGHSVTYQQLDKLSEEAIDIFQQFGVEPFDIVAIQLRTSVTAVQLMIACLKQNIVVLPLDIHLSQQEVNYTIQKFQPKLILTDLDHEDLLMEAEFQGVKGNTAQIKLGQKLLAVAQYGLSEDNKPQSEVLSAQRDISEETAAILCTSGTTGFSKGVVLSNQNILYSELQFNRIYNIDHTAVSVLPSGFYHAIGFHHGLISTILAGSTLILIPHYTVNELRKAIEKYHCTHLVTVPTVAYDVLTWFRQPSTLTKMIVGGAVLSEAVLKQAKDKQLPIYNIYGLTESVPFLCTSPAYFEMHQGMTTAGYPIDGMRVQLVDAKGSPIQRTHQLGEIMVQGPTVFKGYYQDRRATQRVLTETGWLHTGDLGHMTADGGIAVDGRIKDLIIRGGENISTKIIEEILLKHPAIKEAAVVGVKDPRLGEIIGTCVVLNGQQSLLTLAQIKTFFEQQCIAKKFWPERLYIMSKLPKTSTGKIQKYLLVRMIQENVDTGFRDDINYDRK